MNLIDVKTPNIGKNLLIAYDEFLRGDHPKTLLRGRCASSSLEAEIINSKYVNGNTHDRIGRDFQTNQNQCRSQ